MAKLTGGCQCGAVRYEWVEKPAYSSVCYCRMCQKASGQPFMGLTGGKSEHLKWTRGALSVFRSSNMVERGFCPDCGTPLSYAFDGTGRISVDDQQPRRSRSNAADQAVRHREQGVVAGRHPRTAGADAPMSGWAKTKPRKWSTISAARRERPEERPHGIP